MPPPDCPLLLCRPVIIIGLLSDYGRMAWMLLVTGATGNVGSEVVRGLLAVGQPVRAAAYHTSEAREMFGDAPEIVPFDFTNPATFADAFVGVERLFLVRPPALSNVERDIAPAVTAAVDAGVQHIVFLSIQGVEQNKMVPHYKIEQLLSGADVAYTFLRCGFFMQNLSTTHRAEIRDQNAIVVPVGQARTSFIDVRDIAAVAVKTLTEDGHIGQIYTLTGAEALDYHEVAATLSNVLGREIRYTNPSPLLFLWRQWRGGSQFAFALVVTALYTITRMGNAKTISSDVSRLLGRQPITFARFAADHRACWER